MYYTSASSELYTPASFPRGKSQKKSGEQEYMVPKKRTIDRNKKEKEKNEEIEE
jgi:hypothetical protein